MHTKTLVWITLAALSLSACATKSYVDQRVAGLDSRLDEHGQRIDELAATSQAALQRAEEAGVLARGKFLYTVVLNANDLNFATNESALSEDAQSQLQGFVQELKAGNRNVYLEIQGHTDATGPADYNMQLGMRRAESVRRFLHAQGVSLNRMASISYGEDAPAESNASSEGRAVNRRVEIVVME